MTNPLIIFLGLLLAVVAPLSAVGETEQQPVKQELQLIYVVEAQETKFIFVIGQAGFTSVAALKQYLQTLPPGSELRWAPGCERLGGEPLLSSVQEMQSFRAFLEQRGIKFVLVPSG